MKDHDAQITDAIRMALSFFLVTSFIATIPFLIFKTIPLENKEIIVYIIGQLSGMATTAVGYYFVKQAGQDSLDSKRAETTGKMADAVVAAASAVPTSPSDIATNAADAVADAAVGQAKAIADGEQ